jgi:3-oxosteroid 1-dehydrogenase
LGDDRDHGAVIAPIAVSRGHRPFLGDVGPNELDSTALRRAVELFNLFARTGKDLDFRRGDRAYDRTFGDPTNKPNPCLGAIERGPFYAVAVYPGDVGTFGGLVTDEYARVLRGDGSPIHGLYATGNSTASVMGRCYPGAGANIGASFVFGYLAARHAAGATANG